MIDGKRVLALVPARGGSKGLLGKNLRPLLGKPLVGWSVEQGRACLEVDDVVVSTDDAAIAEAARIFGAEVPFLRPLELATDTATTMDAVHHALDSLETAGRSYDILVLLEPTSPLREPTDISGALAKLIAIPDAESVVGVARVEGMHPSFMYRLNGDWLQPYGGEQPTGLRRQELEPLYFLEGSVYVSYVAALRARHGFYHERAVPWMMPRYKSLEIDELSDFIAAEALLAARMDGRL